jgi:hypothetical protein
VHKAIVEALARHFGNPRVVEALNACVGRDEDFVADYLDANFEFSEGDPTHATQPARDEAADVEAMADAERSTPQEAEPDVTAVAWDDTAVEADGVTAASDDVAADGDSTIEGDSDGRDEPAAAARHEPEEDEDADEARDADKGNEHDASAEVDADERKGDAVDEAAAHEEAIPSREPPARRADRFEQFADTVGFTWDAEQQRFVDGRGRFLVRERGQPFPFTLYTADGVPCTWYWLAGTPLCDGVDLPAEVWTLVRDEPESHFLVFPSCDEAPWELMRGTNLVDWIDAGRLGLYPAAYRLREKKPEQSELADTIIW